MNDDNTNNNDDINVFKDFEFFDNIKKVLGEFKDDDDDDDDIEHEHSSSIDKEPPEFLELCKLIRDYDVTGSENWKPEFIEVYIWPYEYAPDDPPVKWPIDWPDCNHPTSIKRGDSYSIYLESTKSEELYKISSERRQKQAIGINGKKWAISSRNPIPSEKFWMGSATSITPEDIHPVLVLLNPDPWSMVIGSDGPVFLLLENGRIYYQTKHGMKTKKFDILPENTVEDLLCKVFSNDILPIIKGFLKLRSHYVTVYGTDQPTPCINYWYKSGKLCDTSSSWEFKSVSVYGLSIRCLDQYFSPS